MVGARSLRWINLARITIQSQSRFIGRGRIASSANDCMPLSQNPTPRIALSVGSRTHKYLWVCMLDAHSSKFTCLSDGWGRGSRRNEGQSQEAVLKGFQLEVGDQRLLVNNHQYLSFLLGLFQVINSYPCPG